MKRITMTEMAAENKHLAEHPEVMDKELYWQGKRMPVEKEKPFAEIEPSQAIEVLVQKGKRGKRGPGGQSA